MSNKDPGEEYPTALRLAIKSIDSELSFDILILLIKNDGMTLDEIFDELAYHNHQIENELDSLQTGGVVEKRVGDKIGLKSSGKYRVSEFGNRMLNAISVAGNPNVDSEQIKTLMDVD